MKKLLAMVLALVMCLGITTMAWATEGDITVKIGSGNPTSYTALAEAITAVNDAEGTDKVVLTLKANEHYIWTQVGGIKITRSNVEVYGNSASVTLSGDNTYAWIDNPAGGDKLIAAVVLVQEDNVTLSNLTVNATYQSGNVAAVGARKDSSAGEITGLKLVNVTANNQAGSKVGAICLQNVKGAEISSVTTQFNAVDGTNPDVQLSNSVLTVGDGNVLTRGYITGDTASIVKLNGNVVVDVAGAAVERQDLSKAPIEVKNGEDVRYFSSLRYALMNTASGSLVKLNGDVTIPDGAVTATCAAPNIVFNGQGNKITAAGGMYGTNPAIIASKGNSTFKNIVIEFKNSSTIDTAIHVTGGDTVDNVKITATGTGTGKKAVYGTNCAEDATVTIKNCKFDGMAYGYYTEDATKHDVVLEKNTFDCQYVSILRNTGKSTITGNTVNGGKLNICAGEATITKNTFENNSEIRYYGENVDMKLTENNIIDGSKVVIKETPAEGKKLDLTNNYWGGTAPGEEQITGGEGVSADVVTAAKIAAAGAYKTTKVNIGGEQQPETPPRYYYNSTTTTTKDDTKSSPKTFDAGVGIYAVSAVLSVTGMAYVGKKKF